MFSKITISGKICTGKSSVFRALRSTLGWPTFSTGAYFREYAKTHKLELNAAAEQTEELTRKVDGMVKDMLHKPGHLLLDSWLAGIMAQGAPNVLKVLLTAQDPIRYARFAEREKVSLPEAEKEVVERDTSWFDKVKKIHNRSDFFDTKNYDVVIDTSSLTVEEIVQKILSLI